MSILIKGMEKPKNCCSCFLAVNGKCPLLEEQPSFEEWYEDGAKNCPLEERPNGKWEKHQDEVMYWWTCSVCHRSYRSCGEELTNYCDYCGAEMEMEE